MYEGPGVDNYTNPTVLTFPADTVAQFVRIYIHSNWGYVEDPSHHYVGLVEVEFAQVPEPATAAALLLGAFGFFWRLRRR